MKKRSGYPSTSLITPRVRINAHKAPLKGAPLDRYRCFAELQQHETFGEDYHIDLRKGVSSLAVIAPHGGGIEFGTDPIAQSIADPDHTFWAFKGIKKTGNRILHITSTRFDVPDALKITLAAQTVVTIHGCRGEAPIVHVGGRHSELKSRIRQSLCRSGFNAEISEKPALRGENPTNLCNRCIRGRGVQLEITKGLRKTMFTSYEGRDIRKKTECFFRFTNAVKTVLAF